MGYRLPGGDDGGGGVDGGDGGDDGGDGGGDGGGGVDGGDGGVGGDDGGAGGAVQEPRKELFCAFSGVSIANLYVEASEKTPPYRSKYCSRVITAGQSK